MQGRFKRLPQGVLYLGGEITEQLKLGLVARSLANMLLKFVRARVPGGALHYSFGDKDGTGQIAHITMPLWSAADRLVITPVRVWVRVRVRVRVGVGVRVRVRDRVRIRDRIRDGIGMS